jgi:gluconokinase
MGPVFFMAPPCGHELIGGVMAHVPGLRSPYATVGRIVYLGRMLDKIRLLHVGKLPADYWPNLGQGFDARTCEFLGVDYEQLKTQALGARDDANMLAWCGTHGIPRSDAECRWWNNFMMKRGWRDDATETLQTRVAAAGLTGETIATFFDLLDFDEGRDPVRRRAWALCPARAAIVMGVAGCGKTTLGRALADELGWRFADADEFHPPANVVKMAEGIPLEDTDRQPWLENLRDHVAARLHEGESLVLACSALKAAYRQTLVNGRTDVYVVYLHAPKEVLRARLQARSGHFMKPGMLDSQLATLEPPSPETSIHADVTPPPASVVSALATALHAAS